MPPRPRAPHTHGTGGGSGTTPHSRPHGDGDADAPSGGRRRTRAHATAAAGSVSQAQTSITQAAHAGRPGGGGTAGSRSRGSGGTQGEQLPPGHYRDADGNVRGPDGRYATDPYAPPRPHNRDSEYRDGYRQSTHDEMAARYTDEGQAQGGVPRDAAGNRIPRDQLTWRDERGRVIPYDQLTYDHHTPVVEHWNTEGHNTSRSDRNDWYNDPDNLRPMSRSQNSSEGGAMTERYRQDTGEDYSP